MILALVNIGSYSQKTIAARFPGPRPNWWMSFPNADSVAQVNAGHASHRGCQPVSPPPLPEALRMNRLAAEDASATRAEACGLISQTRRQAPLFLTLHPLGFRIGPHPCRKARALRVMRSLDWPLSDDFRHPGPPILSANLDCMAEATHRSWSFAGWLAPLDAYCACRALPRGPISAFAAGFPSGLSALPRL